jgi:hypothetical protein
MNKGSTTQDNDPLGMRRFALTETAHDLLNRLQGLYGRLLYAEHQQAMPDQWKLAEWQTRQESIVRRYTLLDWNDLSKIEWLIMVLTTELETAEAAHHLPYNQLVHAR